MPSNEVRRLKRLPLDRLDESRLRAELARAAEAFEAETVAADTERKRLEEVARRLTLEIAALRALPEPPSADPVVAVPDLGILAPRFSAIETQLADLGRLRDEQGRIKDLLEAIRLRDEAPPRGPAPVMATEDVVRSMAAAVAKAAADLPGGLVLGAVEVDVRGPLGAQDGRVTVALDPARTTPEAVSSLRFSLLPESRTKAVE